MTEELYSGVRLDVCHACHGAWFDGGELEAYNSGDGSQQLSGVPGPGDRFTHTGQSTHIRCPRCESDILRTGRIRRYEVMRCTSCGGLFLPLPDPNSSRSEGSGLLDSAVKALETIVAALF
jgi:hypothetical protein